MLNSSENLHELSEALATWRPGADVGLSLCLYGPPGTGKTEYVRYLAARMDRPLLHKRASDIFRPYVGQTEQQIADAFRQAEDDGAVLLFDEVDSFLRDRQTASHSWEITAVNEFLQQLEAYHGVVACTTNLWADIDQAALRRFVIKAEFRHLRTEQALVLFRRTFARELGSSWMEEDESAARVTFGRVTNLAPGDFAAVVRRVRAIGRGYAARELLELVVEEARVKLTPPRTIGFD